jgi:hypothetical protein
MDGEKKVSFRVREFDMERDLAAVEDLERRCQVGLCGDDTTPDADHDSGGGGKLRKTTKTKKKKKKKGMTLSVELVGDPLARVRHAPEHVMLVSGGLTNLRAAASYQINKHITNRKQKKNSLFGIPIRSVCYSV